MKRMPRHITPVLQQDPTGCGIASAAAIARLGYAQTRTIAKTLGIHTDDRKLWTDTAHVRRLLMYLGFSPGPRELPFPSWNALPDLALLSIKWHIENDCPCWHWVVFVREHGHPAVLDSRKGLCNNRRTDFGRMKPKWFIPIIARSEPVPRPI